MARKLGKKIIIAPPMSFTSPVTVAEMQDAIAQNGYTIYLNDDEIVPETPDAVWELIAGDGTRHSAVATEYKKPDIKAVRDATTDEAKRNAEVLNLCDSLDALSKDAAATDWRKERMEP